MLNSDILRRIRFALRCNDNLMLELFKLGGMVLDLETLNSHLKKEDETGYSPLNNKKMTVFLDGLITKNRGAREQKATASPAPQEIFNNNLILRKLKIALQFREEDLLAVLKKSDMEISKSELSALFRQRGHKNYKECGDQLLRNFLAGLAKYQKPTPAG